MKMLLFVAIGLLSTLGTQADELPAFPGAEGYGRYVTGGRGGRTIHVTNLNDSGEGSLRWAVEQTGPRIIVFDVSGTIELKSRLNISPGDVTIAGQTAPGDGICLKNYDVKVNADNVIVRFIRCRMGNEAQYDGDAMSATGRDRVIIDHCTMSWSTDECGSFYGNTNFTLQWCLLSESLANALPDKGSHGFGGIWGGEGATFHHNMLAHHTSRNPRLCGSRYTGRPDDERVDLINNVFYNWGPKNSGYGGEGGNFNFINNYYKPGPSTATKTSLVHRIFAPNADSGTNGGNVAGVWGKFYVAGNVFDNTCFDIQSNATSMKNIESVNTNNWNGIHYDINDLPEGIATIKSLTPFEGVDISQHNAEMAYEKVLAYAGASYARDVIDQRIMSETEAGVYTFEGSNGSTRGIIDTQDDVEGFIEYKTAPRLRDSDGDGIPNAWETANGLDPHNIDDASQPFPGANGYTAIEVYVNSLVEDIMRDGLADAESTNTEFFPAYVQPTYTDEDYYQPGESTAPEEDNRVLVGGTPAVTLWEMTNDGPLATSTSNLLDTELTISGLLKQMNGGYLRYASEYWVDNSSINDTVCLKYVITPQDANYLAIDSLTFYAKCMGTSKMRFSALYDTRESFFSAKYLFSSIQPAQDWELFTYKFERPVLVSPGESFIFKIMPHLTSPFGSSTKYAFSCKDVTFYGRTGTQYDISTSTGITPATATPALTAQILTGSTGETSLHYTLNKTSKVKIEIVSLSGQTIHSTTSEQGAGQHDCLLPLNEITSGCYICRLTTEEGSTSLRIIKK